MIYSGKRQLAIIELDRISLTHPVVLRDILFHSSINTNIVQSCEQKVGITCFLSVTIFVPRALEGLYS